MNSKLFSDRIRNVRAEKGLSQGQVAKKVGFSQSKYSKLESDPSNFRLCEIELVAKALDITLSELMDDTKRWENITFLVDGFVQQWKNIANNSNELLEKERREFHRWRRNYEAIIDGLRKEKVLLIDKTHRLRSENLDLKGDFESRIHQLKRDFDNLKRLSYGSVEFLESLERSVTVDELRQLLLGYNANANLDLNDLQSMVDLVQHVLKNAKDRALSEYNSYEFPKY